MKEKIFKIIFDLEEQGWELLQLDFNEKTWFATASKEGLALYFELDTYERTTCCYDHVCSVCGDSEDKGCYCNADLILKKDIHNDYVEYKNNYIRMVNK